MSEYNERDARRWRTVRTYGSLCLSEDGDLMLVMMVEPQAVDDDGRLREDIDWLPPEMRNKIDGSAPAKVTDAARAAALDAAADFFADPEPTND